MLNAELYRLEGGGVIYAYIAGRDDGLRWIKESEGYRQDAGSG